MQHNFYHWYEWRFWRAYLVQMRPYLLFVSGAAGLAGIAAGYREPHNPLLFAAAFLPLFLGYGFGQAFTDCFQLDTDRISAPYRPLSQGIVSPWAVGTVSLLGLVLGVGLLVYLNPWNALSGTMSVLGLATYTWVKRNIPLGGPPYNAWIVALLPLMGYAAMQGSGLAEHLYTVAPMMALSFVSYANFVLMGYLKDISADRQSGYHTFTVEYGWMATVRAGHLLALTAAIIAALLSYPNALALLFWAMGTALAIHGQWYAHTTTNQTEANAAGPISATVRSFILWHLAVICAMQPDWCWGLVAFYAVFEWVLRRRPAVGQV